MNKKNHKKSTKNFDGVIPNIKPSKLSLKNKSKSLQYNSHAYHEGDSITSTTIEEINENADINLDFELSLTETKNEIKDLMEELGLFSLSDLEFEIFFLEQRKLRSTDENVKFSLQKKITSYLRLNELDLQQKAFLKKESFHENELIRLFNKRKWLFLKIKYLLIEEGLDDNIHFINFEIKLLKQKIEMCSECGYGLQKTKKLRKSLLKIKEIVELKKKIEHTTHQLQNLKNSFSFGNDMLQKMEEMPFENKDERDQDALEFEFYIRSMPNCAERKILELIALIKMQSNSNYFKDNSYVNNIEIIKTSLLNENQEGDEIDRKLNEIKKKILCKNFKQAVVELEGLLKEYLSPLNIFQLKCFVQRNNETNKLTENENITLLIGKTGSGKSTSLLYFSGCKMIKKQFQISNENYNDIEELKNVVVSSKQTQSETKLLTFIKLSSEKLKKIMNKFEYRDLNFIDTPGFGDTNGVEVDISNSIGILSAIQKAKSVKILFLLSEKSIGEKCEGVPEFLRIIINFCPDIDRRLDCFMFLFTKFEENGWKNLPARLSSFDFKDEKMNILLNKMKENASNDYNRITPEDNNPKNILNLILSLKYIPSPLEAFILLNPESKQAIQDQINRMEKNLKEALKRDDFEYSNYILDSFNTLCNILNENNITCLYKKNVKLVLETLLNEIEDKRQYLNKCLLPENSLKEEDIKMFRASIAKNINRMKCKHFQIKDFHDMVISSEREIYEQNLRFLLTEIEKQIDLKNEITIEILSSILKIKFFTNYLKNVDSVKNLFDLVNKRLVNQTNFFFTQENIEKINEGLCILESLHSNIRIDLFYKEYERQKSNLVINLKNLQNQIKNILLSKDFTEQDFNFLNWNFKKLEYFKINHHKLEKHIEKSVIESIYQAVLKDFELFCQGLIPDYKNEGLPRIDGSKMNNIFDQIRKALEALSRFPSICESVDMLILIRKEDAKKYISDLIDEQIDNYEKNFQELELEENNAFDEFPIKLTNCINNFNRLSWFAEYSDIKYTAFKNEIQDWIKHCFNFIFDKITDLTLNFNYAKSNIGEYSLMYLSLMKIGNFEYFSPEIKEPKENAQSMVIQKLSKNLEEISYYLKNIRDKSFNIVRFEQTLLFLKDLSKSQLPLKNDAAEMINQAYERVDVYFYERTQAINENLNFLEKKIHTNDKIDEEQEIIVENICRNMKEIKEIHNSKILNLLLKLPDSFNISIVFNRLFNFIDHFKTEMNCAKEQQNIYAMKELLEISCKLNKFDQFYADKSNLLSTLNGDYFKILIKFVDEKYLKASEKNDYRDLIILFSQLRNPRKSVWSIQFIKYSEKIKNELKAKLTDLYDGCKKFLTKSLLMTRLNLKKENNFKDGKFKLMFGELKELIYLLKEKTDFEFESNSSDTQMLSMKELNLLLLRNIEDLLETVHGFGIAKEFKKFEEYQESLISLIEEYKADLEEFPLFTTISERSNKMILNDYLERANEEFNRIELTDFDKSNPKDFLTLMMINYDGVYIKMREQIMVKFKNEINKLAHIKNKVKLIGEVKKLKKYAQMLNDDLKEMLIEIIELNENDLLMNINEVNRKGSLETNHKQKIEEEISLNYIQMSLKMKLCPKCKFFLEKKSDSTTNIKCTHCKIRFCWFCLKKWENSENSKICLFKDCSSHLVLYEKMLQKGNEMKRIKKAEKSLLKYKIHYLNNKGLKETH